MKKRPFLFSCFALSLLLLASCGNSDSAKDAPAAAAPKSAGKASASKVEWPDNDFTVLIPKPEAGAFLAFASSANNGRIDMSWTADECKAYAGQAKTAGFTELAGESGEGGTYIYSASNDKASITIMRQGILVNKK